MSIWGYFLTSWWSIAFTWVGLIICVVALVAIAYNALQSGALLRLIFAVFPIAAGLFFVSVLVFAHTHAMVSINTAAIVIDETQAKVIGNLQRPGIIDVPAFSHHLAVYPSILRSVYPTSYDASVSNGNGVKIDITYSYNSTEVNWLNLYKQTGGETEDAVFKNWNDGLTKLIKPVIGKHQAMELTKDRDKVTGELLDAVAPWFKERGVPLEGVSLVNWDFTNPAVSAAFDANINSELLKQQAELKLDAAEAERKLQEYQAETQGLVLQKLASGQAKALSDLGISGDQARAWYLVQRQIIEMLASKPNQQVIVTIGGSSVMVPAAPTALPGQ